MKQPEEFGADPIEALAAFCVHVAGLLLGEPVLRDCRHAIGEAERLPAAAARLYDSIFDEAHRRAAVYAAERFGLTIPASIDFAHELIGRAIHPRFTRALFGVDADGADADLAPIRLAIVARLAYASLAEPIPSQGAGT